MKIEKITDNQIRCTLTKSDLADRQLKLSELAYGTEKAKDLFRDMMQQASYEFGFEAEDIPLMIEAIPLSAECVILIITKVEYPEELDTRFSKFSPSAFDDLGDSIEGFDQVDQEGADMLDLFGNDVSRNEDNPVQNFVPLTDALNTLPSEEDIEELETDKAPEPVKPTRPKKDIVPSCFVFTDFDSVITAAAAVSVFCQANSMLFKDRRDDSYVMTLDYSSITPEDYNRICNVFSEYGTSRRCPESAIAYLYEHHEMILENDAIQTITELNK